METIVFAPQYRVRVQQRLAVVASAREHGLTGDSRRFGLDRKTVWAWGLPERARVYTFDRFSMALHGLTPAEKLIPHFSADTAA